MTMTMFPNLSWWVIFSIISTARSLHFEYAGNFSKPADFVTFAGRGAITYAITNADVRTVYLHTTYYQKGRNESALALLTSVRGTEKGFGRSTKIVNHPYFPDTGSLLFVSADDPVTLTGAAYLYTGKWGAWTQVQRLAPLSKHIHSDFGKALDVDTSTSSLSTAVVGCPYCNDTKWAGQIYVYSPNPTTPGDNALSHTWSHSQTLIADIHTFNESPTKVVYFLGSKVHIHGDVILALAQMYPHLSVLTYVRNTATGKWSHQQALRLSSSVTDFALYEDTIVLTSTSETVGGHPEAGAVYVFYPNTNEYFVKSVEIGGHGGGRHSAEDSSTSSRTHSSSGGGFSNLKRSTGGSNEDNVMNVMSLDPTTIKGAKMKDELLHSMVNPYPKSTKWSQQQVLHSPTLGTSFNFGSDVSLQKNTLVVGEQGTSTVYVYHRPDGSLGSHWSQAQLLKPNELSQKVDYFSRSFLHGGSLVIAGIIGTQTYLETFSSSREWRCVVVRVSDEFGDGWGGAQLQVQTPVSNSYDYFSPFCNYPNPFTFRYCPIYPEDSGVYTFSIPDGFLSKYHWEMHYQVYEEKSNTWYYGNSDTEMSFTFDSIDLSFNFAGGINLLHRDVSCEVCPETSPFPSWAHLEVKMTTTGGYSWFQQARSGGTRYSISDSEGRRELATGTLCGGDGGGDSGGGGDSTSHSCWHVLYDGTYTFRVTGDLNDHNGGGGGGGGGMSWSFCNTTGAKSTHMYFKISNGACVVLAVYSLEAMCNANLNALAEVELSVDVTGVEAVSSTADFAAQDRAAFSVTLSSLVEFTDPRDVKFVHVTSSLPAGAGDSSQSTTTFNVVIVINTKKAGFLPADLSSITAMTASAVNTIQTAIVSDSTFFDALKISSAFGSTYFHSMSSVTLNNIAVKDLIHVVTPVQLISLQSSEVSADGSTFVS